MRTYFCDCGGKVEVTKHVIGECKCGKLFGAGDRPSHQINMRNTLSGTTKMEFNTITMDESIKKMRGE
jgi:hypothetical protein